MLRSLTLLSCLKDEVNRLIPECAIQVDSESLAWHEVSTLNVERLHTHLRLQHPEAGTRYWRTRGWGLLIWQPIYLAVIAAHKCQMILPLNDMGQNVSVSGIPSGVLFKHCQFKQEQMNDCVQRMAADLLSGCHNVYSYWRVFGLPRKNADRVVADCVLSALLMVYPTQVDALEELGIYG